MVNSNTSLTRGRKEEKHDFLSYLDELKSRVDIIQVAEHHGMEVNIHGQAECFNSHHEKTSSLTFYDNTQSYHCSGCNARGDVISLVQQLKGCTFQDAVNSLASFAGMQLFHSDNGYDLDLYLQISSCLNITAAIYHACLKQDDPYLKSRGISYETARRFMIGVARGKDDLDPSLRECGFDHDTMILSGVVKKDCTDFFQDHIVVPITHHGKVIDFYGRSLSENGNHRHWRLPNDRIKLGEGLFNWDPRAQEIILVEGVFDALALIENGFENAVATMGTNGLQENLLIHSSVKKVWMCFDGDGAGRENGLKRAYQLKDKGLEVKILDLPDGQDPNEFFMDKSSSDFKELMLKSTYPEVWEIEHLDPHQDEHEKIRSLENVMRRARKMEPMYRGALIKRIAKTLGLREKDVREHIESIPEANIHSATWRSGVDIDLGKYELIHPALHYGHRENLMCIPLMVPDPQSGRREWEPWVITSEREIFPLTHEELNKRGYYCNDIVTPGRQRFSQQVIRQYLEGSRKGDLAGTFNRIKAVFQRYLDFSDPTTYEYLTAWTIGTYFFPIFNYYPYLHFTGTKEVGKSKAMKLMSQLCFNGIMSVSITDASQFRIITELLPTLFLDETENLNDRTYSERRALLLGGYEKGSTAIRTERVGDTFKTREYDNYSPRVFGSIEGLEDTLASRTIQIPMRRSYDEQIKSTEVQLSSPEFEELRDEIFLVAMTYGNQIRSAYEQIQRPADAEFDAREWNLFKPILAIGAETGDSRIVQALVGFANQAYKAKTEALNETSVENVILRCLSELVQKQDWYELDQIHRYALDFIKQQGLNVGVLSKDRLGKLIHDLDVVDSKDRKMIHSKKITVYLISPEKVQQVALNYRVQ